jgi:hypothetical protein
MGQYRVVKDEDLFDAIGRVYLLASQTYDFDISNTERAITRAHLVSVTLAAIPQKRSKVIGYDAW